MTIPAPSSRPILCFGEILLRLNAAHGARLSEARTFDVHIGGAEANVAAALAALGHATEMITALPASMLGDLCVSELRRAGIGVHHILRGEGRLGTYFIEHGSGPRPAAIVYDRAGSLFANRADEFAWDDLAQKASWFHLSGINLPLSTQTAAAARSAVKAMNSAAVPISFDVNHRASLWNGRTEEAAALEYEMMNAARVLFASKADLARALRRELPDDPRGIAEAPLAEFASLQTLVSTQRSHQPDKGQCLSVRIDCREGYSETQPFSTGPVVDRIGSGDAVAGAVIDAILRDEPLEQVAAAGVAAGVLKVGIAGDRWVGTREELAEFHETKSTEVRR